MTPDQRLPDGEAQIARLARELDEGELFVQKLLAYIVAIRGELMAGHTGRALSMCNQALTEIDNATDVVAPSPAQKASAGLAADTPPADSPSRPPSA